MARKKKQGKSQPFSLKQEHDRQYKLVHKRLSDIVESASEDIKEMCALVLRTWEEEVSEESKRGEAFVLYGLLPKTVYQVVPEDRIQEGRNPRPWTGEDAQKVQGNFYVIDVEQDPFAASIDDDVYEAPLPLNMALKQAFAVTSERFYTPEGNMKQPNNPECRRIYQGVVLATMAKHRTPWG